MATHGWFWKRRRRSQQISAMHFSTLHQTTKRIVYWFWLRSSKIRNREICTRTALLWQDTTGTLKAYVTPLLHELKFELKVPGTESSIGSQHQSFNRISRSVCILESLHHRIIEIQNVWIKGALGRVYLACHPNTTCNTLQRTATRNALQHTALHCNTFQPNATKCNIKALKVYVWRVTFIRPATHYNALQHIVTRCNTL